MQVTLNTSAKNVIASILLIFVLGYVAWILIDYTRSSREHPISEALITKTPRTSLADEIVGKWEVEKGGDWFEFFADGSFNMKGVAGKWSLISENRIKMSTSALGITVIQTWDDVVVIQNKLTATVDNDRGTLVRVSK